MRVVESEPQSFSADGRSRCSCWQVPPEAPAQVPALPLSGNAGYNQSGTEKAGAVHVCLPRLYLNNGASLIVAGAALCASHSGSSLY